MHSKLLDYLEQVDLLVQLTLGVSVKEVFTPFPELAAAEKLIEVLVAPEAAPRVRECLAGLNLVLDFSLSSAVKTFFFTNFVFLGRL